MRYHLVNRLYELSDWIQYLQYESEKRMNQLYSFIIIIISLLQILIPIYIYSQNIVVIIVYGLVMGFLAFVVILVIHYGSASKRQKLAEQLLTDILVTKKYRTTNQIREAWICGLKNKIDNDSK